MPPSADLALYNAHIYTVDDRQPTASAVAIRNGRILMVGSDAAIESKCPSASRIDARGRTIVPGFIDAHAHLHELGQALCQADLTGTRSPEDAVERLQAFAEQQDLPPDAWLRGHGWNEADWSPPDVPTRDRLDAAFPERPVWLTRADVHAGWANTAALEATVGLDRLRRMDDPDGGRIHRTEDGQPTGILVDEAMTLVTEALPPPTDTQQRRHLRTALRHTARYGLTGLHDAGVTLDKIGRFHRFIEDDALPLRVYAMVEGRSDAFDHFCERGPYHDPSGRLHVESAKFFADGALGSRGAALLDDYADDPGNRGLLLYDSAAFRERVQAAVEAGLQVNTHAIGDRANRFVLDAYEAVMGTSDRPLRRPRIEHAQVLAPGDAHRFGALDVLASVQPLHATSDKGWVASRLGADRLDGAYAWKSLQAAGAPLAFGSDAPVEPIDPIRGFHAAVTRQDADGHPEGGWHPPERLSRAEALYGYTQGAAYAAFMEDEVGSIAPGMRADLTVLSQDLMRVPADTLLDTEVVATYLGGTLIHSIPDWPDP